jgi:hypothetical protein
VKSSNRAPSATSLPRAPRDDADARSRRYLITMGIRIACFLLMVFVTPYGWYTWVFGAAAIFLPYIAVVSANVSSNVRSTDAESPELAIPATPHDAEHPEHGVIRVEETHAVEPPVAAPAAKPAAKPADHEPDERA